jgi:hypothetical protein
VAIHNVSLKHSFSTYFYITSSLKTLILTFEAQVGYLQSIRFNISNFYIVEDLRTNGDYFPLQLSPIGFVTKASVFTARNEMNFQFSFCL